ncbi:uncharacterized protein DUF1211 [Marinoscillum furvescens DSM 4134]|uniref:Uncharacterized protein DUF1211 n=2 Tax=Marinoscillum furvescens TaxID=1026 RepID=A0A3D9L7S9_MARFU|nr:uncharacterized protein DUF1211 [Marinoscillum furvescens DSM 4134]
MKDQEVGLDPNFRYRGKNQTRVETFSDAAFALAITLIVLSSSVPSNFQDLWVSMRDIIPFGLCVILVMVIWYQHYLFFLKFGLQNRTIVLYNTFLIFLILIYVYPLKFLFVVLFRLYEGIFTGNRELINRLFTETLPYSDTGSLMIIYGLGASLIFLTIGGMYRHAMKMAGPLELNSYERYIAKDGMITNLLLASIPFLSALIAVFHLFGNWTFLGAGVAYMLYPPVMIIYGRVSAKKRDRALAIYKKA